MAQVDPAIEMGMSSPKAGMLCVTGGPHIDRCNPSFICLMILVIWLFRSSTVCSGASESWLWRLMKGVFSRPSRGSGTFSRNHFPMASLFLGLILPPSQLA
jgi:hypothetical protein